LEERQNRKKGIGGREKTEKRKHGRSKQMAQSYALNLSNTGLKKDSIRKRGEGNQS